ncbi:MAG: glutamate--tRNA ligase [Pseudomonadota bacterium]
MTVTRFAPSPTGHLHIGNLRTALFNWLVARQAGGTFILRIDDTDGDRSDERFVASIREDLTWLGLTWDREERQSERRAAYDAAADRLRADNRLYEAFETPAELELKRKAQLATGRPPVYDRAALDLSEEERDALRAKQAGHWRFRLDWERITWDDRILGPQSIDAASVSDPVLIRGDGQLLYTLASVVDDLEMGITHVVRGADHVTNTATQVQIMAALGAEPPVFAHTSLLTGPGGEKLAKRFGALTLRDLRAEGIEPMAILSLLARLGSADPVELRGGLEEIAEGFDLSRFGAAPVKFDPADLRPLSARAVHALPYEAVAERLSAIGLVGQHAPAFWMAVSANLERVEDAALWWRIATEGAPPEIEAEDRAFVAEALTLLPPRPWDEETWGNWTKVVKAHTGRKGKALFMPLRKALTGQSKGPDMGALMPFLTRVPSPEELSA